MRKYVIAAALIFGFAAPALADEIYVILDTTTQKCTTMRTLPKDMKNYKILGNYPTPGEAETAMHTMTDCK